MHVNGNHRTISRGVRVSMYFINNHFYTSSNYTSRVVDIKAMIVLPVLLFIVLLRTGVGPLLIIYK